MIHRAKRGIMECKPLSGNAGVSFFFTKWKLNISNPSGLFPSPMWNFSSLVVFYPIARVSAEGDLREDCIWTAHLKSLMTMRLRHSRSQAQFFFPPSPQKRQHIILPHFNCHSGISFSGLPVNTVCSCSVKFFLIRAEVTLSKNLFWGR